MTSWRERVALWVCPVLRDELAALRSGNTKLVLEREALLDMYERAMVKEAASIAKLSVRSGQTWQSGAQLEPPLCKGRHDPVKFEHTYFCAICGTMTDWEGLENAQS